MLIPEPVRYENKGTLFSTGMLRYRTEIQDTGMPMPAALTSMPMASYVGYKDWHKHNKYIRNQFPNGEVNIFSLIF